jgi:hypothetical protein
MSDAPDANTQGEACVKAEHGADGARPAGYEDILALAKALGRPVPSLLGQNRNSDPFYAGVACRRTGAEWFGRLWRSLAVTPGAHLRRVHYMLVSGDPPPPLPDGKPYANTEECWHFLCVAARDARHLGLVDAHAFTDHRNPEPTLLAASHFAHDTEPGWSFTGSGSLGWVSPFIVTNIVGNRFGLPKAEVCGYDCYSSDQPYHLELWIEKSTMDDVLLPVCRRLDMNLVTGAGFQSITGLVNLLLRISRLPADKPTRIFYVSDFDPAGDHMPATAARQVEFYLPRYAPGKEVKLTPIALTKEQVIQYGLPRIPIKESDKRRANFESRHGEGATELDALEALRPGELAKIVRRAAEPYRDLTLVARLAEAREEAEDALRRAHDEAFREVRRELWALEQQANQIVEQYEGRLRELDAQLQADLAPWREKLERVRQVAHAKADEMAVELPERPEADVDPPDEGGWLFDSGRNYMEQMAHYPPPPPRASGAGKKRKGRS